MDCLPCCKEYPVTHGVIEISPEQHHDFHADRRHGISAENVLRIKFLAFFFLKLAIYSPFQIFYRLQDLATGGFYYRGCEKALDERRKIRENIIPLTSLVSYVLLELIKDICRIILYPLYFIAIEFSAFIGWFCPVIGMRMVCFLDQLNYVQPADHDAPAQIWELHANLAAPCMQTVEFRREMNLFRYNDGYNPRDANSLKLRIQKLLKKAAEYNIPEADIQPVRVAAEGIRNYTVSETVMGMIAEVENAILLWSTRSNDDYKAALVRAVRPADVALSHTYTVNV